ncbi:MAG: hypothetical protein M5U14_18580 [Acidimicrobiia bacterium]|nr:hypothetical protein [Acidimicrobiia bacterium]
MARRLSGHDRPGGPPPGGFAGVPEPLASGRTRGGLMKKLLLLFIVVAIGAVVAKKVREA